MKIKQLLETKSLPDKVGTYYVSRQQLFQLRVKYKEIICEGEDGEMLVFLVDMPYNVTQERFMYGCKILGVDEVGARNIWVATNRYIDQREEFYYRYANAQDNTTYVRLVTFEQWGKSMQGSDDFDLQEAYLGDKQKSSVTYNELRKLFSNHKFVALFPIDDNYDSQLTVVLTDVPPNINEKQSAQLFTMAGIDKNLIHSSEWTAFSTLEYVIHGNLNNHVQGTDQSHGANPVFRIYKMTFMEWVEEYKKTWQDDDDFE